MSSSIRHMMRRRYGSDPLHDIPVLPCCCDCSRASSSCLFLFSSLILEISLFKNDTSASSRMGLASFDWPIDRLRSLCLLSYKNLRTSQNLPCRFEPDGLDFPPFVMFLPYVFFQIEDWHTVVYRAKAKEIELLFTIAALKVDSLGCSVCFAARIITAFITQKVLLFVS